MLDSELVVSSEKLEEDEAGRVQMRLPGCREK